MKLISTFIIFSILIFTQFGCKTTEQSSEQIVYKDQMSNNSTTTMTISLNKGSSFNHPTFVIWMEDMNGNYIKTMFITKSYSTGVFDHEMIGDSMWLDKPGSSYQPAALPYWTFKKGEITKNQYVPTNKNPYVDAYTGATPTTNFKFETTNEIKKDNYRVLVEVNQTWDWNKYWTNNKYPDNSSYKNSAQPSIVYAVTVDNDSKEFYLNPIGHGDPKGESGKLFTDISTLSSGKEIFESLKIEIK